MVFNDDNFEKVRLKKPCVKVEMPTVMSKVIEFSLLNLCH